MPGAIAQPKFWSCGETFLHQSLFQQIATEQIAAVSWYNSASCMDPNSGNVPVDEGGAYVN